MDFYLTPPAARVTSCPQAGTRVSLLLLPGGGGGGGSGDGVVKASMTITEHNEGWI